MHNADRCLAFAFADRRVTVAAEDAILARLAHLLDLEPQAAGAAPDLVVTRTANGYAIRSGDRDRHCRTRDEALLALSQTVPYRLLPMTQRYILHAGAIIAGGAAHLFLGPAYSGKSTLAFAAWQGGHDVIGDDYLLLDPETMTVEAAPKPLKIRCIDGRIPDGIARTPDPDDYCFGLLVSLPTLVLSRRLPHIVSLYRRVPVGAIYLLEPRGAGPTRIAAADRYAFFRAPLDQTISAPGAGLDMLRLFRPLLREGRAFSLHAGQNDAAGAVRLMAGRAGNRLAAGAD